ncbi:MAG: hypothetical protein WA139_04475 [Candidatus Aenigmatarchaeota archaeon]
MLSGELKEAVMKVGLELYDQTEVMKQEPSYRKLVAALDGRMKKPVVDKALDILSDITLVEEPCCGNKFQYSLSKEGRDFFKTIYNKVILT